MTTRFRTDQPGIYSGVPELDYHADPVIPAPSLSRSGIRISNEGSMAHLFAQHPRLGGAPPEDLGSGDEDMDLGSAIHAAFLEGDPDRIAHIPFSTYQSNAAKEAKAKALANRKIPAKTKQYDIAMRGLERLNKWREATGMFTDGLPEQTIIWNEGDHWCRARVDWLPNNPSAPLLDLKTTGGLATTAIWSRRCFEFGADIQAAFYTRGLEFIRGEPPDGMLFVVVEMRPPYAVRVFGLDPIAVEIGQAKCAAARVAWVRCLREHNRLLELGQSPANAWPGYPAEVEWIMPPPWVVRQWEEAKIGGIGRAIEDPGLIDRMIAAGNFGG